ncbi:MAG: capsule assembly Wzi family protein [Spirochaetaceae bacterium]|nr:capsule assembly Wzi family protein [Spirochaetaceae bacterium]
MRSLKATVLGSILFFIATVLTVNAQQYTSVSLDHEAYKVIENAVFRGIIARPPSAKPWQEFTVRQLLREILDAEPGLNSPVERDIVSAVLAEFERKPGLDLQRGAHYLERPLPKDSHYSLDTGMSWETNFNVTGTGKIGTVNMGTVYLDGDIGNYLSYDFNIRAGILKIDRDMLGERPNAPYFDPKDDDPPTDPPSYSPVFSLPAYFPYSFSKVWEAAIFKPKELSSYSEWPDTLSFGYEIISEIGTALVDNRLQFRFGRMRRDWGLGENGLSLFMNSHARPFMALEGTAIAAPWMYFSFLTGALEYQKITDQWSDAASFQSLFSLAMLEFNSKEHFHFDFGSATIWPKRFDLGYVFPVNSNFFYQNNVGDFDNLALFANVEYRLTGIGKIWGSLFVDEINLKRDFFILDREMYALQGGIKVMLPWLPFASVNLQYTKVEPYCYTHEYTSTPWHSVLIDTAYTNNGEPLGYYLPPNSDEFLLRVESMFLPEANAHVQYQLIRHGVEYGPGRVDGSSLQDKMLKKNNNTKKYFLRDGVYQWSHVVKIGGGYSFKTRKIPVSVYGDFGIVVTQFTSTDAPPGSEEDRFFHFVSKDDPDYKPNVGVIFSVGFKIFP